jgi:rhomboid protease GluP
MYDLNRSDEPQAITQGLDRAETVDVGAEFAARLHAITPRVLITPALVAINILVFLGMIMGGVHPLEPTVASLLDWGANYGPKTVSGGQWWRLGASMFLHIGLIHLAFNMFVLWKAGEFIERLFGNAGFFIVYAVSGLAGAMVSVAWHPYVVSAGASGAIFGLYGALLGYLALRRDSIPVEVLSPLTKSTLVFVGYNLVYGVMRTGTDVADHLGGLAAGFVCGLVLAVPLTVEPPPHRAVRNAAVLFGMGLLLTGAALKLPRPVDFTAEMKSFAAVESKTLASYRAALEQARIRKLKDDQVADLIQQNVLPDWETEHRKLAAIKGVTSLPPAAQNLLSAVLNYMDARQQGWSQIVQGLRTHDINATKAGAATEQNADMLARAMAQSASPKTRTDR